MNATRLIAGTFLAIVLTSAFSTAADNDVAKKIIGTAIRKELSIHDSSDSAWESDSEERHEISKTVFGKKIVVASWTDESSSNVWLDDPNETLTVDVTEFKIKDGKVTFGARLKGKAKFKASYKVKNVASGNVKGSARVEISVEGSAKLGDGEFSEAKISNLRGRLSDVRFSSDLLRQVQGLVKDAANSYISHKNDKYKRDLEKAINKAKLP